MLSGTYKVVKRPHATNLGIRSLVNKHSMACRKWLLVVFLKSGWRMGSKIGSYSVNLRNGSIVS